MAAQLQYSNRELTVIGDITFTTVQELYDQLHAMQNTLCEDFCVQLINVQRIDTAALAFCLTIEKLVKDNVKVRYAHVPPQMLVIAKSVGLCCLFE